MQDAASVIDALERAPKIIVPLVFEVPEAISKRRPKPGKWSAHEHACHLVTVHPIFSSRLDLMLTQPNPYIQPVDGMLLDIDLAEAMDRFQRDRIALVARLKTLTDKDWQRTATHGEYTHYSVFIMFRHLAMHDMFHAYRIEELLLKKDWD